MMRCANSQQSVMAAPSVEYVRGPLKARKLVPRPISKSSVQRPESRIWNVRAVMAKPLYKTAVNCRSRQRSRRVLNYTRGGGDTADWRWAPGPVVSSGTPDPQRVGSRESRELLA